ncbi:MAG: hypothetical protein M0Z96_06435 [Actinomycetota bacterium]|nr:hypothetical protein [Actinomycetota bacterium]
MFQIQLLSILSYALGSIIALRTVSYRDRVLSVAGLSNLRLLVMGLAWSVDTAWLCELTLRADGFFALLLLVVQLAFFPVLAAVDLMVRQVPTLLVRIGSGWTVLVLLMCCGAPSLARAGISTVLFIAPLAMSNWIKPRSIGGGDLRLGIFVGPVVSVLNPVFAPLAVLAMSSLLALIATFTSRLAFGANLNRIPLVPFILCGVVVIQLTPNWRPIH